MTEGERVARALSRGVREVGRGSRLGELGVAWPNIGLQPTSPLSRRLFQAPRQPFGTGLAAEPLGS